MTLRIAIAQINPVIGDLDGNTERILSAYRRAGDVDLVVCPELCLTGYPPRDLLLRPRFVDAATDALAALARQTGRAGLLVGCITRNHATRGKPIRNSAALLHRGRPVAIRHKTLLPNYDVFDESRYFEPAGENPPVPFGGHRLGLTICEDLWNGDGYARDPLEGLLRQGCDLLVNISASPWEAGKAQRRLETLQRRFASTSVHLVYCNMVGGNDELVFDGNSLVLDPEGRLIGQGPAFSEGLCITRPGKDEPRNWEDPGDVESLRRALTLSIADYLRKCGFSSALIGLSGGIDSALTAALAVEALGKERVRGLAMPSRYSSPESLEDAATLAANLGIRHDVLSIEPAFRALRETLAPLLGNGNGDATEENLQARLRGILLMALSNRTGALVLSTGNKSELAVGYCTLYGDMCGGFSVLSDVTKTQVRRLARHLNREREVIPRRTIEKAPSAELRPGQRDQDTLPPYADLDAVLEAFVEEARSAGEIAGDPETVRETLLRVERNEYKRRQAAPGPKVTPTAFGCGRRLPVARHLEIP